MARAGRAVVPDAADPGLSRDAGCGGRADGPVPQVARHHPHGGRAAPARIVGLIPPVVLAVLAAACGGPVATSPGAPDLDAARERAVTLETRGCGDADVTRGSGLAIGDDLVLTAAHVVASGGAIEVEQRGGPDGPVPADLVAYDPRRDLALVRPRSPLVDLPPPPVSGTLTEGDDGLIVGGATSGDVAATVAEVLIIEMDDVRSPTRSTRRGYLAEAVTSPGDSGAGFYDADGLLIGLLFAVSTTDEDRSWLTASSEVDAFLVDETSRGRFVCDPDRSRVARAP